MEIAAKNKWSSMSNNSEMIPNNKKIQWVSKIEIYMTYKRTVLCVIQENCDIRDIQET